MHPLPACRTYRFSATVGVGCGVDRITVALITKPPPLAWRELLHAAGHERAERCLDAATLAPWWQGILDGDYHDAVVVSR
jgi:hypothetical protein